MESKPIEIKLSAEEWERLFRLWKPYHDYCEELRAKYQVADEIKVMHFT